MENSPDAKEVQRIVGITRVDIIPKLAYAVAMAETHDCTKGYGKEYNNCHGIKRGSIYPCKTGRANMCIFKDKSESYSAFRQVWTKGYGGKYPTWKAAQMWTGNDSPRTWLNNVKKYYNEQL